MYLGSLHIGDFSLPDTCIFDPPHFKEFYGKPGHLLHLLKAIPLHFKAYNNAKNSFQKWLRILFWIIIPVTFQNLLPVSYMSASAAIKNSKSYCIAAEADK